MSLCHKPCPRRLRLHLIFYLVKKVYAICLPQFSDFLSPVMSETLQNVSDLMTLELQCEEEEELHVVTFFD
ncbi:unnamed protein product [Rodentolepis nana]|uniref:Secreted protein n=1 Tax=Rodentolepis nana TaxID=102285 RepID=A0A0R3TWM9_RODNA|nr:unnamed protein product [Rodentolepis nana]